MLPKTRAGAAAKTAPVHHTTEPAPEKSVRGTDRRTVGQHPTAWAVPAGGAATRPRGCKPRVQSKGPRGRQAWEQPGLWYKAF